MRIRSVEGHGTIRHVFTYKRPIDGQVVEIETDISAIDFQRLWSQCRESLRKARYSWPDGPFQQPDDGAGGVLVALRASTPLSWRASR